MSFDSIVRNYLKEYQNEYKAAQRGGQHTAELSFRVPIHTLLTNIAKKLNPTGSFNIILEPKNQGHMGRPDWCIQDSITLGVYGYIEGKGLSNQPFDTTPYQNQINRYLTLGHKLVITDGIDFVFCFTSSPVVISLIDKTKMSSNDWSKLVVNPLFKFYMEQFFSNPAPQYVNEEKLIELVAIRTRNLADEILAYSDLSADEALNENERQVIILLGELRTLVYNHNNPTLRTSAVFADFVAQVIMFCLLYAHRVVCSNDDSPAIKAEKIKAYAFNDVANDAELIPFHDLMIYLRNNKGTSTFIGQWIDECVAFLSFVKMTEHQLANPDYHRLFELFLSKFDKQARFDYGAYYTPKKLADFIVRLTNKIANEFFDGATIYDDGNTIIDPCCGTGSFLEQVAEHDDNNGVYNLCGFEILPAPYMLANYRMALVKSKNKHFKLKSHIILANTLSNCLLGADVNEDSIEGKELVRADKLSSMPLKLIIGNPPCSDSNRENVSDDFSEIIRLTNDFRPPAENRRGRQNIQKQVNNPFMLFLRWSCEKLLNSNNHSILAFIVPLSFLEAESYKYARKYLLEKFSKLWAIAIDADARTGIRGDSMFKTLQGRAVIILLRKFGDSSTVSKVNFLDISRNKRIVKEEILDQSIDETFHLFESFSVSDTMYSFMPTRPFNQELYSSFWPISSENNKPAIFLNQCSGAKMAPTALLTHVKKQMLKRRSKEIANDGIDKANEWIGGQDKKVVDDKIIAFQNALRTCSSGQQLEDILNENIIPCSFRPFVNSNALLWKRIFEYQAGVGGGGARIRPEIKAVYSIKDTATVGFSLAHAPKDLDESLGQFASFCWYFPDNDLSRRGNGHIYLNQYICDTKTNEVVTNINSNLLSKLNHMTGIPPKELARKMVFYSYAIFCSQVYLEEFYGALFVVNQSESRARIPIVNDSDIFNKIAEIGERLAELEKNETNVDNILNLDYEGLLSQITPNFHLEHSKSASKSPYDEENELFLLRDELTGNVIEIYCPAVLQKFTVSGYNVIKDCWLKFHSYRFTHCNFTQTDFRELLDLFNKIALQMKIVAEIDEIMHNIVDGIIPLISYNDEK